MDIQIVQPFQMPWQLSSAQEKHGNILEQSLKSSVISYFQESSTIVLVPDRYDIEPSTENLKQ